MVRELEGQNFYVPVGKIYPVVDGPAGKDADFHAPAQRIVLMIIRMVAGKGTDLLQVTQKPAANLF